MSDLAPLVAAALRDKVVGEMRDEISRLRARLERQRQAGQTVAITGPMGSPVYARADLAEHGKFDASPELWKVEFRSDRRRSASRGSEDRDGGDGSDDRGDDVARMGSRNDPSHCTLRELSEMEVRIGGILKAKLIGDCDSIEGFVNDIDNNYQGGSERSGAVSIWFGGSSGVWLTIRIGGIEKRDYSALRDFDLSGSNLMATLLRVCSPEAPIDFREASFLISHINDSMEAWGIATEPTPPA